MAQAVARGITKAGVAVEMLNCELSPLSEVEALIKKSDGRGLQSSTSQVNLSRSWSLKPYQAPASQLNLGRFLSMEATATVNKQCSRQAGNGTDVAHK